MNVIFLTKGKKAFVSDEDYEELSKYKWYANQRGSDCYAHRKQWIKDENENRAVNKTRGLPGKRVVHGHYVDVSMHRAILKPADGLQVDHINGNGLDNRRENLRVVDASTNAFNQKIRSNSSSGIRGVSYEKMPSGRWVWRAIIWFNKKRYECGRYDDINDAIKARQDKVKYLQDAGVIPKVGRT